MIKFLLLNLSLSVLSFSAYADSENGLQRLKDCEVTTFIVYARVKRGAI